MCKISLTYTTAALSRQWVLSKATGYRETKNREGLCASKVHGDRVNNQYSGIYELNAYGK